MNDPLTETREIQAENMEPVGDPPGAEDSAG
jgi:hypothetical protein